MADFQPPHPHPYFSPHFPSQHQSAQEAVFAAASPHLAAADLYNGPNSLTNFQTSQVSAKGATKKTETPLHDLSVWRLDSISCQRQLPLGTLLSNPLESIVVYPPRINDYIQPERFMTHVVFFIFNRRLFSRIESTNGRFRDNVGRILIEISYDIWFSSPSWPEKRSYILW